MKPKKYSSFWPLPGGAKNYVRSLIQMLNYIFKTNPSKNQLIKWIIEIFPKVTSEKNAKSYVDTVLKHSGLVIFSDTISINKNGEIYLKTKDNIKLFKILDENILGFNEILRLLGNKPYTIKELHTDIVKVLSDYNISWTTDAQPRWRIYWLVSMGFAQIVSKRVTLTNKGVGLLSELNLSAISLKEPIVEPATIAVHVPEVKKAVEKEVSPKNQVGFIIEELEQHEHASNEPERYEIAIMKAFNYFGFKAEHLGESGSTDVIAVANLGSWKYSMIIDGKTTKKNRVIERQISWPTIGDHRTKHGANYAIIVGPEFAGGDLIRRSENFKILLITTKTLIELLKIHSNTPLSLVDFEEVFSKIGILSLEDCINIVKKIDDLKRQIDLIPKLLRKLQELQEQNEATTITSLYWSLNRGYSNKEISKALDLFQHLEIVIKSEGDEFVVILSPDVAALKLRLLRKAILT